MTRACPCRPDHGAASRGRVSLRAGLLLLLGAAAALFAACDDTESPPPPPVEVSGTITTWAGTGLAGWGSGNGHLPSETNLFAPTDLTFTSTGDVYIADWDNHAIRHAPSGGVVGTVMGDQGGYPGDGPEALSGFSDLTAPGCPGGAIYLNHPTHVIELDDGRILVTCWHNHKLRILDPVTDLAFVECGRGVGFAGDNGPISGALFNQPSQTAQGPDGSLYVLDQKNQRIRKISPTDTITTVVGTGVKGFNGDGDGLVTRQISQPTGSQPQPGGSLIFDAQGRLYLSDVENHRIRRIDFALDRIETIAGNGVAGFGGDDGQATEASLNNPRDLVFGPDGRLYVADELNNRVRAIDLSTGIITTVAGDGLKSFGGDGGPATLAHLNRPAGLDFDADGNLYIADSYNHRIRRVAH